MEKKGFGGKKMTDTKKGEKIDWDLILIVLIWFIFGFFIGMGFGIGV